jgi:hypothetical protein
MERFMNLQVKKNLFSVLAFVGVIWAVYLINLPLQLSDYNLNKFGLEPRTAGRVAVDAGLHSHKS